MRPLHDMPARALAGVDVVFTDIDDTLTTDGLLPAEAYTALWRLYEAGLRVVPVTGRPAGWCDHIARMWPVEGVVGENGAFAFTYDRGRRVMRALHTLDGAARADARVRLDSLCERILREVPGAGVASDQAYRLYDLAIDFREDVPPLDAGAVTRIVELFEAAGATAKVSSIHVNGWFGAFDKLSMILRFARECLDIDLETEGRRALYVGDSPNDCPAFAFFENAVGVANVVELEDRLDPPPRYVTPSRGGAGFAEVAAALIEARAHASPSS